MGGYSHLFPSGQFPRFIFSWFCVPVYNAVFVPRGAGSPLASLRFTCRVRSARDPETSRDHLLDRTIEFRADILRTQSVSVQIVFCARVLSWRIVLQRTVQFDI